MWNINRQSKSDAMSQTVRSDPSRNKDSRLNTGWAYGARSHQMNTERDNSFTTQRSKRETVPSSIMPPIALHGVLLIAEGNLPFNESNALIRSKILTEYGSIKVKKYHYDGCRTLTSCVYGITKQDWRCTFVWISNGPPCSNTSLLPEQGQLPTNK
jgi:hypothetical protein